MSVRKEPVYCSPKCQQMGAVIPIPDEELEQARELYESGMTWDQVAAKMEINQSRQENIVKILKSKYGFKSRIPKKSNQTGASNDSWKGGRVKLSGYVSVKTPGHPRGSTQGYVFEHILVMEKHIGRYLVWGTRRDPNNEVVHHINGDRADNRLENLVLMTASEHCCLHSNQKSAKPILDSTHNVTYDNLEQASIAAGLNQHELATYIHFGWKRHGTIWQYVLSEPITARILED
jgi:hypothetical protein